MRGAVTPSTGPTPNLLLEESLPFFIPIPCFVGCHPRPGSPELALEGFDCVRRQRGAGTALELDGPGKARVSHAFRRYCPIFAIGYSRIDNPRQWQPV